METTNKLEHVVGSNVPKTAPLVSIIIPAYMVADFVEETLDSVMAQELQDFEVILVNDASPDTEVFESRIQKYADSIVYLKNGQNEGAPAAKNTGIAHARGRYLAFLDPDDVWFPDYLASQVLFQASGGFDFVWSDALLFGSDIPDGETFMKRAPSTGPMSFKALLAGTCHVLFSASFAVRRKVEEVGGFDKNLRIAGDFDLWARMLKAGATAAYQKRVLLKHRVRSESLSGSNVHRVQRMINALQVVERKHALSDDEHQLLIDRLAWARKKLALENAKTCLVTRDFTGAKKFFSEAVAGETSLKYRLLTLLLAVSPGTLRVLFRVFRREEYRFIVASD